MEINKNKIYEIIIHSIEEINEELKKESLNNPNQDTHLYSSQRNLDSLSLVNLIVDVEQKIALEFKKNIVLADEKAMSQFRSPFRTVQSFSEYIEKILSESNNE